LFRNEPPEFWQAVLLATTGGFLPPHNSFALRQEAASGPTPSGATNIVLVHGAFADGSSWSRVIPLLEAKGFNVSAAQNPLTSLADDVATTRRLLAKHGQEFSSSVGDIEYPFRCCRFSFDRARQVSRNIRG
jgi:pimeloyl-ACP methyl ester carboxylesterase